ncbi:hypothetical protein ACFQZR_12255 [Paenibacillus sp. GCM10027629]|uniref:hypothetical protein n=1 Tax=Paenibacillus sp. GCM10027629 TaxID=3273414 RepID=UPI00363F206F
MIVSAYLDGAKVIMYVDNDVNRPITKMLCEEDNGSSKEIIISGLALAKYENSNEYYLFLCDKNGRSIKILTWDQLKRHFTS